MQPAKMTHPTSTARLTKIIVTPFDVYCALSGAGGETSRKLPVRVNSAEPAARRVVLRPA